MSGEGIPQIACVMGSCTAGGAYVPAMSDETVIVRKQGTIFLAGPPLVKAATGEEVSAEDLGGADVHARQSGVADHYAVDDAHALSIVRNIVASLNRHKSPDIALQGPKVPKYDAEEIGGILPDSFAKPYDVREIIARHRRWQRSSTSSRRCMATTLVTGFRPHPRLFRLGFIANNGILFSESSLKGAHFIELCLPAQASRWCSCRTSPASWSARNTRPAVSPRTAPSWSLRLRARRVPKFTVIIGGSVRRRQLWHVRAGLFTALPVQLAEQPDFGDGRPAGCIGAGDREA